MPGKPLDLFILDKTVPTQERTEHRSFIQIVINNKYTDGAGNLYRPATDYYGFFPKKEGGYNIRDFRNTEEAALDSIARHASGTYFTDTYGIYNDDWHSIRHLIEAPSLVYGGLHQNDVTLLRKMKRHHKLIMMEFNTLSPPTSPTLRVQVERLFGIRWTGWTGRYFESLDTLANAEIPEWLITNYMAQHNGEWPFSQSGIVFVHGDGRLGILEHRTHLNTPVPVIETAAEYREEYDVSGSVPYPFWFDIVTTDSRNKVISEYRLDLTALGKQVMQTNQLPEAFPAVIAHAPRSMWRQYFPRFSIWGYSPTIAHFPGDYTYYYFAGDFADNPVEPFLSRLYGIQRFRKFLYSSTNASDRRRFFWEYYYPLINTVLESRYNLEQTATQSYGE
ncbi:MAG: hypothetical protein K9N46_12575 [Candidatus Marinimicrobia bacterium]|nr:hypothetical protein [Candidatus Neomarinimicrobiota bacterium]MCF7827573.1 hypothetical protein [Candidatus Neomarinimicrobiota bacterium]MCF7881565.1 hypothetical protein [Candidatus Neomarinimicrobiota bacterium]